MGAQMAIPPFLVISEATYPIRRMLMSRCSFENPSSDDRCLRTRSPSRIVTGRPPVSRNLVSRTLAMVDFPEPDRPVKKDRDALPVPWRIAPPQFLDYFRIREPAGNVAALVQTLAKLSSGNIQDARIFRHFIVGNVFVLIFEVDHHVKGNHRDADVRLVFLEKFLRLIRTIEGFAVSVLARTGVIASDNEVRAAMVLADQAVPDRFAGPPMRIASGSKESFTVPCGYLLRSS